MHEFLRSIGFSTYTSKKKLQTLVNWVTEAPDALRVVSIDNESNLASAEREISPQAGITVVGEVDERGTLVPEYYYPYITSQVISSTASLLYEKQAAKEAYIGMCEDYRLGMALIFNVHNIADVLKHDLNDPLSTHRPFTAVCLSALMSDATVLLPLSEPQKVLHKGHEKDLHRSMLVNEAEHGNAGAADEIVNEGVRQYEEALSHLNDSDLYSLIESFIMPHGMESDRYYFMGEILNLELRRNSLTGEAFYRFNITANGMEFVAAVNVRDLLGTPFVGARLKGHAWFLGVLKR